MNNHTILWLLYGIISLGTFMGGTIVNTAAASSQFSFAPPLSVRPLSFSSLRAFLLLALLLLGSGFPCFAQTALPFNDALGNIINYVTGRITAGSTVAVLNFQSDYPNLSEYIIDDITSGLVNTDRFTVVDRRSLEILQQEMAFQLSGEVDDETALAIGKKLGAQTVISGAVSYLGEFYRLRVQAIEVETARIQGSQTLTIRPERLLATLTGNPWTGPAEPEAAAPALAEPGKAAPAPVRTTPARASTTRRFYLGLRGGVSPHLYLSNEEDGLWDYYGGSPESSVSMEAAAQMSLQIVNFLALQVEAVFFAGDTFSKEGVYPVTFSYSAIMLPILGKLTFRPGIFLIAGFGGVYFTVPFGAMTLDVNGMEYSYSFTGPIGFIGGGNFGIKLGPGTLFLDLRYAGDFSDIAVYGDWGSRAVYQRSLMSLSLGYEFGFGGGKGK
jgi:TolB-like protein